jgi:hypothetical protein
MVKPISQLVTLLRMLSAIRERAAPPRRRSYIEHEQCHDRVVRSPEKRCDYNAHLLTLEISRARKRAELIRGVVVLIRRLADAAAVKDNELRLDPPRRRKQKGPTFGPLDYQSMLPA